MKAAAPLAHQLIDERFAHLPAPDAALDALRLITAQPPENWETGLRDIAERVPLPVSVLRTTLADLVTAWNEDPRAAAQVALRDIGEVKTHLVRQAETRLRERVNPAASGAKERNRLLPTGPRPQERRPSIDV